jgi:predicted Zn-dependent peptidase
LLTAAAVLALATHQAAAQDISTPELTSYRLDNGLEVILAPDHKVPKVAMNLYYNVGSANEPAGRSGFAHLFEHLMLFAGTPAYPKPDQTFSAAGAYFNGFTQVEGTNYVASGMSSALPLMLSVYADQMANIGAAVDQADLDLQRAVVLNEMRQNVLDAPGMSGVVALLTSMVPAGHPYSRVPIGSIADVEAATLDDVRAFFNAYYVPNNAVLVLVGDFDVEVVKAMIEDTFGRIPRGSDVVQPAPTAFEPTLARIEVVDAVAAPVVQLAFNGPDTSDGRANAALLMATQLLNNESGLLRKALVNTGLATAAGITWTTGKLGGNLVAYAVAAPNVGAEQLEAALRQTLADFLAAPVDAAEVERTRSALLLLVRAEAEAFATRATLILDTKVFANDLAHVFEDDPDLVAVTAADIARRGQRRRHQSRPARRLPQGAA